MPRQESSPRGEGSMTERNAQLFPAADQVVVHGHESRAASHLLERHGDHMAVALAHHPPKFATHNQLRSVTPEAGGQVAVGG